MYSTLCLLEQKENSTEKWLGITLSTSTKFKGIKKKKQNGDNYNKNEFVILHFKTKFNFLKQYVIKTCFNVQIFLKTIFIRLYVLYAVSSEQFNKQLVICIVLIIVNRKKKKRW